MSVTPTVGVAETVMNVNPSACAKVTVLSVKPCVSVAETVLSVQMNALVVVTVMPALILGVIVVEIAHCVLIPVLVETVIVVLSFVSVTRMGVNNVSPTVCVNKAVTNAIRPASVKESFRNARNIVTVMEIAPLVSMTATVLVNVVHVWKTVLVVSFKNRIVIQHSMQSVWMETVPIVLEIANVMDSVQYASSTVNVEKIVIIVRQTVSVLTTVHL